MVEERQEILESNCLKGVLEKMILDENGIKDVEGVHGKSTWKN